MESKKTKISKPGPKIKLLLDYNKKLSAANKIKNKNQKKNWSKKQEK